MITYTFFIKIYIINRFCSSFLFCYINIEFIPHYGYYAVRMRSARVGQIKSGHWVGVGITWLTTLVVGGLATYWDRPNIFGDAVLHADVPDSTLPKMILNSSSSPPAHTASKSEVSYRTKGRAQFPSQWWGQEAKPQFHLRPREPSIAQPELTSTVPVVVKTCSSPQLRRSFEHFGTESDPCSILRQCAENPTFNNDPNSTRGGE